MQERNAIGPAGAWSAEPTRAAILSWLGSARGLIVSGIVIVVAGLALGWNWVVAFGLAPLILAIAPCAVMCALGLCMMSKGSSGGAKPGSSEQLKSPDRE